MINKALPQQHSSIGLPVNCGLFAPGDRICVAASGGADSTALLRTLAAQSIELGIVLSVLHVEHGLRGDAALLDATFVAALAEQLGLPCEVVTVDTLARAAERRESIEEAARNLRYQAFRDILASGKADKIATAHTQDDQAETVLMKLLRGAWTEGLSGIHPVLAMNATDAGQLCIRPFLEVTRAQVEAYLRALNQPWREDETNRSLTYTRNRIRHELLPALQEYNPAIARTLAHMAANARAEEEHWQAELARVLPHLLLPGKPVRGRSVATAPGSASIAIELTRLQALDAALRRRVLRAAAERCGATLDFEATEQLLRMSAGKANRAAKRLELPGCVRAERTMRELQFERMPATPPAAKLTAAAANASVTEYELPIPGTVEAPAFQSRYTAVIEPANAVREDGKSPLAPACVRAWQPGDRVELTHSRGSKKVKEVLERIGIRGQERTHWPVIVWHERIIWMRGVEIAVNDAVAPRIREIRV